MSISLWIGEDFDGGLNFSQSNAEEILGFFDPDFSTTDPSEWGQEKLSGIQAAIRNALDKSIPVLVKPTLRENQGRTIFCGRNEEYVTRRLNDLLALVTSAIEQGQTIFYA